MIYHVITEKDWNEQKNDTSIEVPSLQTEGFIHCCTKSQLSGVLDRYFKGIMDLLILELDTTKIEAEVRFEKSTNEELFPHVYGAINKSAIVRTYSLEEWNG
jgi:uncharacterized protein (DUF952 family)